MDTRKRLLSTDLQILLRGRYEQSHGIFDHAAAEEDHFALVRHNWSEDTITASRLRERMESYLDATIHKHFGLSFTEFIDQPTYVCDLMIEVISVRGPRQDEELKKALDAFKENDKGRK